MLITVNVMITNWLSRDKIQACPKVQNGEIDLDALCSELQRHAKCSPEGPVFRETDLERILNSLFTRNHVDLAMKNLDVLKPTSSGV